MNILACSSFDSTITIYTFDESLNFDLLHQLEGQENEIKQICWDYTGTFLGSVSRDKTIWIWEKDQDEDYQCYSSLMGHT